MEPSWQDLERQYDLMIHNATPVREQIGRVYRLSTNRGELALKWYREGWDRVAKTAATVMAHLNQTTTCAPILLPTTAGDRTAEVDGSQAILWHWVDGDDVDKHTDAEAVLALWQDVQSAMSTGLDQLPRRRWSDGVDRYRQCLAKIHWSEEGSEELLNWSRLWMEAVEALPTGFQHGDFHTGNVLKTNDGLVLLDYDACGIGVPLADLATMYDRIPFHDCTEEAMRQTVAEWRLRFAPDSIWIPGLLAVLPLRHMEIIANILIANGTSKRHHDLFDKQYAWMKHFHDNWVRWTHHLED